LTQFSSNSSSPWATASAGKGENPWASAAHSSTENPWGKAAGGAAPASHAPLTARSASGNWLESALTAGNRLGKHLATGGGFGLPDAAGEAADDAKLNSLFALPAAVEQASGAVLGPMLAPATPNLHGMGPAALRTGLDPTWLIPGKAYGAAAGLLGKGAQAGARALGPLLQHAPVVQRAAETVGDLARGGMQKLDDLTHWGGSAHRELGPETYQNAILASNRAGAGEQELARRLAVVEAAIFKGLTPQEKLDALAIAHGEADVSSSPAANAAAKAYRQLRNDEFYLQANKSGRTRVAMGSPTVANAGLLDRSHVAPPKPPPDDFEKMVPDEMWEAGLPRHPDVPANGPGRFTLQQINREAAPLQKQYQLPPNLREFAQPDNQGILGAENYRKNQVPGSHPPPTEEEAAALAKERPEPYNRLFPSAPQALHQKPFRIGAGEVDPSGKLTTDSQKRLAALEEAIAKSHKATARQTGAAQLRSDLGFAPGQATDAEDPLIKLFEQTPRAKGPARNLTEQAQDIARIPVDMARAGLTAFGLKHGLINVPTLAALSEPKAAAEMFGDAAKMVNPFKKMTPEERWEYQREAREAGVLGPAQERQNPIVDKLEGLPLAARAGIGLGIGGYEGQDIEGRVNPNATLPQRFGAGALGAGLGAAGGASKIGGKINDLTWALDEAAKARAYGAKLAPKAPPVEPDIFRYQSSPDVPEVSPLRGGTFFSQGEPATGYGRSNAKGVGGRNLVKRVASAKNPLDLRTPEKVIERHFRPGATAYGPGADAEGIGRFIGVHAAEKLRPGKPTAENLIRAHMTGDEKTYTRYLRALGVSPQDIAHHLNHPIATVNSVDERIGAELARRAGHDAIIANPMPEQASKGGGASEFFALHPSAYTRADVLNEAARASHLRNSQKAATETLNEMIDYHHRTPLSKGLQDWGLAPFATFAAKVPGAVARSVARDPRKAMLLDRLTQGLGSQGTLDLPQAPLNSRGGPTQFSMSTPLSETIRAGTDPLGYARTKASAPAQWLGSILSAGLSGNPGNAWTGTNRAGKHDTHALYPTHGKPLGPYKDALQNPHVGEILEGLLRGLPLGVGEQVLDETGMEDFAPPPAAESAISQILGPIVGGYIR